MLAGRLADVANVTMDVSEWADEIVFLHKVKPGAADRSTASRLRTWRDCPSRATGRARCWPARDGEAKVANGEALLNDLPLFAAARRRLLSATGRGAGARARRRQSRRAYTQVGA